MGRSVTLFAKQEPTTTGTSRYAVQLATELARLDWRVAVQRSRAPWSDRLVRVAHKARLDPTAFWHSYPLTLGRPRGAVVHIASQTLATAVALIRPPRPVVVTVHDILPYTLRHDPVLGSLRHPADLLFYRLALTGIRRADLVLADSLFTADELARHACIRDEAIRVVPLGVNTQRFRPVVVSSVLQQRYELDEEARYLLYVGSEDPRKNLAALMQAFSRLAELFPDVLLIKVGPAHHVEERNRLRELTNRLGIVSRVRFLEHVGDDDLVALYSAAAVCVVPSLYEGFGLPVLEAMACGAPVVCSSRSSLPEVAGDAAITVEPTAIALAGGIERVLASDSLRLDLRAKGLRRATHYSWRHTAERVVEGYEHILTRNARNP